MSVPVIAFFNNKGGVGKTTLVYHLAWVFNDLGFSTLAADLDPQANLTSAFLDEDQLIGLFEDGKGRTVLRSIEPLLEGIGDIAGAPVMPVSDPYLYLLPGDLGLSAFEDELAADWTKCLERDPRAFRAVSAFWRLMQNAARSCAAEMILMDLGPNLGALNRAALVASDYLVVPLGPDLFSLQGLKNLGPTLRRWRDQWSERLDKRPEGQTLDLPGGTMRPAGYVVQQHSVRLDRPVRSYDRWIARIPEYYSKFVLGGEDGQNHCLASLKHFRSLMPLAQEARKPAFHLTVADGAIGAHYNSVLDARKQFEALALAILDKTGIGLPAR